MDSRFVGQDPILPGPRPQAPDYRDVVTLRLSLSTPKRFTLAVRRPYWVGKGFLVAVNGRSLSPERLTAPHSDGGGGRRQSSAHPQPLSSSFLELNRTWHDGDVVSLVLPKTLRLERDFNQQGERTSPVRVMGRPGRRGNSWFSFDLPVDPAHPMALVVTYNEDEWRRRTFDILIDGKHLAEQVIEDRGPFRFFEVECLLPTDHIAGKSKVTVRFQATNGNEIAAVFGIRMIRADAVR